MKTINFRYRYVIEHMFSKEPPSVLSARLRETHGQAAT